VKEKIFIIQSERRNWEERIKQCVKKGTPLPPITRRYLLMIKNDEIKNLIKKEFVTYPYSEKFGDIFYCIAGPSFRRPKELIKTLIYKMEKSLGKNLTEEIEILEGIDAAEDLMEASVENN
jgi:hypothetical protein